MSVIPRSTGLRATAVLLACLGVGAVATPVAGAAPSDPNFCSHSTTAGTSPGNGGVLLSATGHASCGPTGQTLRVEIKHQFSFKPDSLLASNSKYANGNFSVSVSSCDGGQTGTYYGRSYFTYDNQYKDTVATQQATCR